MIKQLLLGSLFWLLAGLRPAAAQTLTEYYASQSSNHSSFGFGEGRALRADTVQGANGAAVLSRYYASGQKQEEVFFQNLSRGEVHGTHTRWFANGQIQTLEEYVHNQRQGPLLTYYPSGQLRRRAEYQEGKLMQETCFSAERQPRECVDYLRFPEYPGGLMKLLTTIRDRTTYPRPLIRQGITGKVRVDFVVDKTGTVQRARVVESVNPALDAEALRVVNSLRGWQPGRLDGEPVDVEFSLPVTFAIR
ncbi:energy transducer TonB [Hymenobacter rubripertinctus]|nr:energy transducer TonB [Hymenobacter rubripertinctus]